MAKLNTLGEAAIIGDSPQGPSLDIEGDVATNFLDGAGSDYQ
jgi:hypothetical protein